MAYFTPRELEAFFAAGANDSAGDMEEYLRVLNVAHDLPPLEALAAIEELLAHAQSEDDVAWVAAAAFEAVVDMHYEVLGSALGEALRRNPKLPRSFPRRDHVTYARR